MSYYDYIKALQLDITDQPFYALIQAAMRKADSENSAKLRAVFPEVWHELETRYHAPGGFLPGECVENYGHPHHFVPRREGGTLTDPVFVLRCQYCDLSEQETREKD